MTRTNLFSVVIFSLLFSGTLALAEEGGGVLAASNFSGTATFTTDYVFRGVSNSGEEAAVQASFDYGHPSGVYLGMWGSNSEFSGNPASLEIDYYVGFANALGGLGYDVMLAYYTYPGSEDDAITGLDGVEINFPELNLGLSYTFSALGPVEPTVSAGWDYSPDYWGEDGAANNIDFALALAFTAGSLPITIDGLYGMLDVKGDKYTGNGGGMNGNDGYDYTYYHVGIATELAGFGFDIRYYDTDSDAEDFYDYGGASRAGSRWVFSLSRSL